jgi:hypothetical protein
MPSAEETVMPNAVETGRQHVEEKPALMHQGLESSTCLAQDLALQLLAPELSAVPVDQ